MVCSYKLPFKFVFFSVVRSSPSDMLCTVLLLHFCCILFSLIVTAACSLHMLTYCTFANVFEHSVTKILKKINLKMTDSKFGYANRSITFILDMVCNRQSQPNINELNPETWYSAVVFSGHCTSQVQRNSTFSFLFPAVKRPFW